MKKLLEIGIILGIASVCLGSETKVIDAFIGDVIKTWKLRYPTILVENDLPNLCRTPNQAWIVCLTNDQDTNELMSHMKLIHQRSQQDGLIFIGKIGHEKLLKHLSERLPSIFTSNYPVFMPTFYKNFTQLRLDSNILFYTDTDSVSAISKLYDTFAVKAGPPIEIQVGKWTLDSGMTLMEGLNRWDRRINLTQTTFVDSLFHFPPGTEIIKDKEGNIIGSNGYWQEVLVYINGILNMSIDWIEVSREFVLLDNGSWTGALGFLQRQEADVVSSSVVATQYYCHFIDCPVPIMMYSITLLAEIPKGVSTDMWVYVSVFGLHQWIILIIFLILMTMGLSIIHALSDDKSGREFGTKRDSFKNYKLNSASSALSMVCLYTLQLGSHTNSRKLATRLLTFTLSFLTMMMFAIYATDITANMTSGPATLPIRTFDDVVYRNYKVVTFAPYFADLLKNSNPGSAKLEVFHNHLEMKIDEFEAMNAVVEDSGSRTLFYSSPEVLATKLPSGKMLSDLAFALKMDDEVNGVAGFALQKDSEFLQIFNHYIMKAKESGIEKRLNQKYTWYNYRNVNYGILEAQPLGWNNIIFCFVILGLGISLSISQVAMEFLRSKWCSQKKEPKTNIRDKVRQEDGGKRTKQDGKLQVEEYATEIE